eukprot:gene3040-3801_t
MKTLSELRRRFLLHIIIYGVFLSIVGVFFAPVVLQSKKLFQGDIPSHEGIAKQLADYRKQMGKEPLWAAAVYSGMPAYLIDVQYQEPLIHGIRQVLGGGLPANIGYILAAFVAGYLLLLSWGANAYVAMVGGIGYGLSTFTLISIAVGHDGKVAAMAYMPLVLASVHWAYHKNRWWGGLFTALSLAVQIAATHPQITYYVGILLLVYGTNQFIITIKNKKIDAFLGTSAVLLLALSLAIGANCGRLWTLYEYGKYSTRGGSALPKSSQPSTNGVDKAYAFQWSLGKAETMTLLVPNFYGGSSHGQLGENSQVAQACLKRGISQQQVQVFLQQAPTYRGDQPFTEGPMYLGIVIVFLGLIGLRVISKQQLYWLLVSIGLALLLAYGNNLPLVNDGLYAYLPGYNKFRAVTTSLVLAQVATVLLAGLTLQKMVAIGEVTAQNWKALYTALIVIGGLLLSTFIAAYWIDYAALSDQRFPMWLAQALQGDRKGMLYKDLLRAAIFVGIASFLIGAYWKKKMSSPYLAIGIFMLVLVDFYGVGKRYVRATSYRVPAEIIMQENTPAQQLILQDTTLGYRVLNLGHPFTDGRTSYYHRSVGGYHGAKLNRYQDLIEHGLEKEHHQLVEFLQGACRERRKTPLLNMLNTRYFMYQPQGVLANPDALGSAWLVKQIKPVAGPVEEMAALQQVELAQVAVLDTTQFKSSLPTTLGDGTISLVAAEPNDLRYEAQLDKAGLVVFSEIYYPKGWKAWIDNQPTEILRVNYVLRALSVPAGKHTLTFQFTPVAYRIGNQVTLGCNMLLGCLIAIAIGGKWIRGKRK